MQHFESDKNQFCKALAKKNIMHDFESKVLGSEKDKYKTNWEEND